MHRAKEAWQLVHQSKSFIELKSVRRNEIDPRFLCLPYLERAGAKFCPLDQVVCTNDVVGCSRLPLTKSTQWKLDEITDVKDLGDDLILFRFNESKTLSWLSVKVRRTAAHFMSQRQQKVDMENVAFVSSFQSSIQANVNSKNSSTETQLSEPNSHDIKTAVQVISDYLSESMSEKLLRVFGLSASDLTDTKNLNSKRKTDWEADLEVLKIIVLPCALHLSVISSCNEKFEALIHSIFCHEGGTGNSRICDGPTGATNKFFQASNSRGSSSPKGTPLNYYQQKYVVIIIKF
jgi:hypothetical protein